MKSQKERRIRPDIRCLSIPNPTWSQAKELAKQENRSVSSYLRQQIKVKYEEKKVQRSIDKISN